MVEADRQQYQTVYARWPGAVAAPTAGLHFSESLLRRLEEDGIAICPLTLHTGAGTFRPITAATLAEHRMHSEWGTIRQETVDRILALPAERRAGRGRRHHVGAALGNGRRRWYAQAVHRPHRFVHPPAVRSSTSSMPC